MTNYESGASIARQKEKVNVEMMTIEEIVGRLNELHRRFADLSKPMTLEQIRDYKVEVNKLLDEYQRRAQQYNEHIEDMGVEK